MLLSFHNQHFASIAPGEISLVRLRPGIKPKIVSREHSTCTSIAHNRHWEAEVVLLESLLSKSKAKLPLTVILSNHLVRYKVLPAMPPLMPASEVLNVARQCFRDVYGDAVDSWSIRVNALPHGDSVIASAIDEALFDTLKQMTSKLGVKLKSVQPFLMSTFNRNRHQFSRKLNCFVQVERGRMVIALLKNGAWQSVTGATAPMNWMESLPSFINRQLLLADWQNEPLDVMLSSVGPEEAIRISENPNWDMYRVLHPNCEEYVHLKDSPFSMALSPL